MGIGLAVAGWLNPIVAAVAMVASSALVVVNSLRLRKFAVALPSEAPARDRAVGACPSAAQVGFIGFEPTHAAARSVLP